MLCNFRYEYSNKSTISAEELEKEGIFMKKPGEVTLETEYEKVKSIDIDNWESVRSELDLIFKDFLPVVNALHIFQFNDHGTKRLRRTCRT